MAPLVTVIIPSYNRARYLDLAIESVRSQTYRDFEVIVVDDGSIDDTRSVAERYAPEVRYVWQPNAERGAARNHGLRLARGEYIAFLDSDDVWAPDKLERDLGLIRRRPEAGVVYSNVGIIDASGRLLRRTRKRGRDGWVTGWLIRQNFVSFSAHLARTQAVRDAGGFREERELAGSEDWEFWVRLSTRVQFAHLPLCTAKIRTHDANSMSDPSRMERTMLRACEVMESGGYLTPEQLRLLLRARAMVALACAINYCSSGDRRRTWLHLTRSLQLSPALVLDPRFTYTVARSCCGPLPSAALRMLRSAGRRHSGGDTARRH